MMQAGSYPLHLMRRMTAHGIPPACQDLVVGLLHPVGWQRMGISAALEHPWILQAPACYAEGRKKQ